MRNALLLVMDNAMPGGTLMDVPLLFEDSGFRRHLIKHCRNPYTVSFWQRMAAKAGGDASLESIGPYITSKLNQFTNNMLLRPIIGQPKSTVDFGQCMERGRIVLVDLPKGLLGELDTRLLGMLVIGKLFAAALARARLEPGKRRPFYLYVDEAHNFTTDTMANLLAEARKFGLHLTLANQNLAQVTNSGAYAGPKTNMVEAILGNVGTLLLFRLGCLDAGQLQPYVQPEFSARDMEDLADRHAIARLLTRGRPTRPFLFHTLAPHPGTDPRLARKQGIQRRLRHNRRALTRPVAEVEAMLLERRRIHLPRTPEEQPDQPAPG